MSEYQTMRFKRVGLVWVAIASLLLAMVSSLVYTPQQTQAAELLSRAVNISDSVAGATDVEYEVEFEVATAGTLGAIAIQYCDDSPIIGDASCADARSFNWNEGTLVISNQNGTNGTGTTGTSGITDWAIDDSTDTNGLVLTSATAPAVSPGDIVTFTLGSTGGADGVTNPTGANSAFYLRLHTYDALTSIPCTTSGTPAGTCGGAGENFDFDAASLGTTDDGGLALSTASQLTINARVQEVLTFTVGTDAAADDCAVLAGDTIDLGVLATAVNRASTDPSTDTNVGCAEITTNAANGVQVFYIGDNLKVSGASCGTTDMEATPSNVDQCINRDTDPDAGGSTGIAGGTEQWGIAVSNLGTNTGSNVTSNLAAVAAYDLDTASEYAFVPNTATEFVNSTTVVNQETIEIDAAGTASVTTPTGLYSTTLTFIATATF